MDSSKRNRTQIFQHLGIQREGGAKRNHINVGVAWQWCGCGFIMLDQCHVWKAILKTKLILKKVTYE